MNIENKVAEILMSVKRLTDFTMDIQRVNKTGNIKSVEVDFKDLLNTITLIQLLKAIHVIEIELGNLKKQAQQGKSEQNDDQRSPTDVKERTEKTEEDHF